MPKASFTEEASASTETIDNASNTRSNTSSVAETIGTLLYLDPSDVCQDPLTDIRGPETDDKAEDEAITRLAHTMKNGMQIQPITVRPNGKPGKYKIVAGRRRTLAAAIAKMQVAAYVVELTDDEAYRAAIVENIQRKTLSPVSFARHIRKIREREGWQGADGTKQVSRYFGVSPAEITTHEKILMLDKKIIKQGVQEGWAAQTFFAVAKAQEKAGAAAVPEILEAAQKEADQEEAEKKGKGSAKKAGVSAKSAPRTPPHPPAHSSRDSSRNSSRKSQDPKEARCKSCGKERGRTGRCGAQPPRYPQPVR